jgi:hypothetical protein
MHPGAMIAEAPAPQDEPLVDLRLTIDIDRPSKDCPDGYVGMFVEEKGTKRMAGAADGKHTEDAIKRVLIDVYSYFQNGRDAWTNRIRRENDGRER